MSTSSHLNTIVQSSNERQLYENPCKGQMGHRNVQRWTVASLSGAALLFIVMLMNPSKAPIFGCNAITITNSNGSLSDHSFIRDLTAFSDPKTLVTCLTKATEFSKFEIAPKDIQRVSNKLAGKYFLTEQSVHDVVGELGIPHSFIDRSIRCVRKLCDLSDEDTEDHQTWKEEQIKAATDTWQKALYNAESMQSSGLPSAKKAAARIFEEEKQVAQVRSVAEQEQAAGLVAPMHVNKVAAKQIASQLTKHLMIRIQETLGLCLGETHEIGKEMKALELKIREMINRPRVDTSERDKLLIQILLPLLHTRIEARLYNSISRKIDSFDYIQLTDYNPMNELADAVLDTTMKDSIWNLITLHFPTKWWVSVRFSPNESAINQHVYYITNEFDKLVATASSHRSYLERTQAIIIDV